jgi:hypothetical protein
MVDAIARVRFSWNSAQTVCRAAAYDLHGNLLGEVAVELTEDTWARIRAARGQAATLRIEEVAERHLRTMLEMRY